MSYLFTSESVSEGHPDKVADQISDAILDEFLRQDSESKVACETFVSTGLVVIGGEVRSEAYVDIQGVARRVINKIGYTKAEYMFDGNSCGILSALHEQSPDINRGVVVEEKDDNDDGYINTAATEEQLLEALAANVEEIELTDVIALSSALTIDYNTTIVGGGFTGKPVYVKGETVAFYDVDFANGTDGDESSVYVKTGNKNVTFDNCSFTGYKWEAIQYVAEDGDWV